MECNNTIRYSHPIFVISPALQSPIVGITRIGNVHLPPVIPLVAPPKHCSLERQGRTLT